MKPVNKKFTYHNGSFVSFRQIDGESPAVFYLHGTQSSIDSTKAMFVQNYCQSKGIAFTSLNFRGHGDSSGKYTDGNISMWLTDALNILDNETSGGQVIVGSSMGGWIMLLLAMRRPDRVKGLLGLAAAPDFTVRLWNMLPDDMKQQMQKEGLIHLPSEYTKEGEPFTFDLIQDGYNNLILNHPIPIKAKTILMQGDDDICVPFETAQEIKKQIGGDNVRVEKIIGGKHNLSTDEQLHKIAEFIDELRADS